MEPARAAEERRKQYDVEADEQEQTPRRGRSAWRAETAGVARLVYVVGVRGTSLSRSWVSAEKSAVAAEPRG
jgi:hypothetical protein